MKRLKNSHLEKFSCCCLYWLAIAAYLLVACTRTESPDDVHVDDSDTQQSTEQPFDSKNDSDLDEAEGTERAEGHFDSDTVVDSNFYTDTETEEYTSVDTNWETDWDLCGNAELTIYEAKTKYSALTASVSELYADAWETVSAWTQECSADCDVQTGETSCIQTVQCDSSLPGTASYLYAQSMMSPDANYGVDSVTHQVTVDVIDAAYGWQQLMVRHYVAEQNMPDDGKSTDQIEVSFDGLYIDGVPSNLMTSATFQYGTTDTEPYNYTMDTVIVDDCTSRYECGGETCTLTIYNASSYVSYAMNLHEQLNSESAAYYGFVGAQCIGRIDKDSWQILGDCSDIGNQIF